MRIWEWMARPLSKRIKRCLPMGLTSVTVLPARRFSARGCAATTRVRLCTAVLLPLLRHPVSLTHALATLDRISKGRVIVGIGPGAELPGTHAELKAIGVPSERRVGAMLHSVERCRRLWRGDDPEMGLPPKPARAGGPPPSVGGKRAPPPPGPGAELPR